MGVKSKKIIIRLLRMRKERAKLMSNTYTHAGVAYCTAGEKNKQLRAVILFNRVVTNHKRVPRGKKQLVIEYDAVIKHLNTNIFYYITGASVLLILLVGISICCYFRNK